MAAHRRHTMIALLGLLMVAQSQFRPAASSAAAPQTREESAYQRLRADSKAGRPIVAHVYVALCDNVNQGIIPVPKALGNGLDPARNLYWGARYGVDGFFSKTPGWHKILRVQNPRAGVLQRAVFRWDAGQGGAGKATLFVVADAYEGSAIAEAMADFLDAAGGASKETLRLPDASTVRELQAAGMSHLVAYVGHNGLMDRPLARMPARGGDGIPRCAVILACASRPYFESPLRAAGAFPLLWTTGLMAPEAYTLAAALETWMAGESAREVRRKAAQAYDRYQKCGLSAAYRLFAAADGN
jgi:hypothetical protein